MVRVDVLTKGEGRLQVLLQLFDHFTGVLLCRCVLRYFRLFTPVGVGAFQTLVLAQIGKHPLPHLPILAEALHEIVIGDALDPLDPNE
jgi:hypothetical protein